MPNSRRWAARCCSSLGRGLGNPAGGVRRGVRRACPATLIKVIRYPGAADSEQGVGAHRDAGVLTLLLAEPGSRGCRSRGWAGGEERRDSIRRRGPAARGAHREHRRDAGDRQPADTCAPPSTGCRSRTRERLSVAYFFNPRLDAQLPVLQLPAELAARARGVTDDPSNDRIYAVYGRNAWKSRRARTPTWPRAHRSRVKMEVL